MASQEDYLDNLLRGLNGSEEAKEAKEPSESVESKRVEETKEEDDLDNAGKINFSGVEIEEFEEPDVSIGVEATRNMTEEDIERLLSESVDSVNEKEKEFASAEAFSSGEDLLGVLSQEENRDLQEIHTLLQKADNNEKIAEDTQSDLSEYDLDGTEYKELVVDDKVQRAEMRKRERDERRAKRVALREAKKAEKMDVKAAKEAERKAKKAALAEMRKEQKKVSEMQETQAEEVDERVYAQETEDSAELQQLKQADMADLDELLSMAENAMSADDDLDNSDFFASFSADEIGKTELSQQDDISQEMVDTTDSMVEKIIAEKQPQKKKMINRIMDLLTEEIEDEDETKQNNEDIQLSDENQSIIEELDKAKKKTKKKDKKAKKGKEEESSTGEESEEENAAAKTEKKPSKKKKEKKEKPSKEIVSEEKEHSGGKKLSAKRIMPIVLFCVSLVVIIILAANIAGDYSARKEGREAYYRGDYQTCYQNLYGKKWNESEQVMYRKSESILRIRLWIREYEMFAEEGADAEALDSLIQSVNDYPKLYEYAAQWTAASEVSELYTQILGVLSEKYQLTEAQALEIAATENDTDYSEKVYAIVDGEGYGSWEQAEKEEAELLQDVLAEEEELEEISFLDNSDT